MKDVRGFSMFVNELLWVMLMSIDTLKVVFVIDNINGNSMVMCDNASSEMIKTDHIWVVHDATLGMVRNILMKI